jgi:hypothetical protein
MGTRGPFLGLKRPEREVYHSPPIAKVRNAWNYTSTPQYAFMAWWLVKHKENFTFALQYKRTYRVAYIDCDM